MQDKRLLYGSFIAILLVNLFVFYPSFFYLFQDDQWEYFLETRKYDDVYSLVSRFFAFENVRQYNQTDLYDFRPLLWVFHGVEKWLFGPQYVYWHIVGFILHIIAVWYLFKLLMQIQPSLFVPLLVFLFSGLFVVAGMVTGEHFTSYLLALTIVLAGLYYLQKYSLEGQTRKLRLFVISGAMVIASFMNMFASIYAVMFAFYLWIMGRRQFLPRARMSWLLILIMPAVIFWGVYFIEKASLELDLSTADTQNILNRRTLVAAAIAVPEIIVRWVGHGIFPAFVSKRFAGWDSAPRYIVNRHAIASIWGMLNSALVIVLFLVFTLGLSRKKIKENWPFMALLVSMMLFFVGILSLVRLGTHGESSVVFLSGHHPYDFWAFLTLFIYSGIDYERLKAGLGGYVRYFGIAVLLVLTFMNLSNVYQTNRMVMLKNEPARLYMDSLHDFVKSHRDEKDFSFVVKEDIAFRFYKGAPRYMTPEERKASSEIFSLSKIFYWRYTDEANPKYVLQYDYDKQKFLVDTTPGASKKAIHGIRASPLSSLSVLEILEKE